MNELVSELQYFVNDLLMPASQRNDRYAVDVAAQRQEISYTWYAWAQELFCDTVGFYIGGPSFIHAFSYYLGMRNQSNYYRQPEDLRLSSHPVTWLRVHFLSRLAYGADYPELAKQIEIEWRSVARLMGVREDYHGFYDESLDEVITHTIEDMLVEAEPRRFTKSEAESNRWSPDLDSPVQLFNWAWRVYIDTPTKYLTWEAIQVERLLTRKLITTV
jgi:hypothetical protein